MKEKSKVKLKTILILLLCVALVICCVIISLSVNKNRKYETMVVAQPTPNTVLSTAQPNQIAENQIQDAVDSNEQTDTADDTINEQTGTSADTAKDNENNISGKIEINYEVEDVPDMFDAIRYVKQGYELGVIFAVDKFESVKDIPISRLVQYGFCNLYSNGKCLVDVKIESMQYRSANEKEISNQISNIFGECPDGLSKSDLYNSSDDMYEMWQPDYKADVYAKCKVTRTDKTTYQIEAVYYSDNNKKEELCSKKIQIKKNKNGYYFAAMNIM